MQSGLQKIYHQVARNYELVNRILTFGFDVRWRKRAARLAAGERPLRCIDVCSGTGEMASELSRVLGHAQAPVAEIVATDFSPAMLQRAKRLRSGPGIRFALAEAGHLPFADASVDLVSISFGTRNINRNREILVRCFREFHRVLRPGGVFLNLETSQPANRFLRFVFHLYIRLTVRPVGTLLTGSRTGYAYLAYTIPRFYKPEGLDALLQESGFAPAHVTSFLGGIAAIHLARKANNQE